MILGMTASTFTLVHVLFSLVGIGSGFVVTLGLLSGRRLDGWTALFLGTTVATSVTGFFFPFDHLLPSHKVGVISLVVLAVAILARYALHLAGLWRGIYVVAAEIALYLNVFVAVVQAFLKVPALKDDGSVPDRAALPGRAGRRSADFRWAYYWGGKEVQPRSGTSSLITTFRFVHAVCRETHRCKLIAALCYDPFQR
jgi:hypothetical protein